MADESDPPDVTALIALTDSLGNLRLSADPGDPPERLFPELRSMVAADRLYGVTQLLRAGTGATVAAATVRSLLEAAAISLWESGPAAHRLAGLAALEQERLRVMALITEQGLTVPNWERWLAPLNVTQTLGRSTSTGWPDPAKLVVKRSGMTSGILGMTSAVANLLAMAGHANAAAAWISVADAPHPVGFEPTPVYRALLAQAAGRSATYVVGLPPHHEIWNKVEDLDRASRAVTLMPATPPPAAPIDKAVEVRGFVGDIDFWPITERLENVFEELLSRVSAFAALLSQGPDPYAGPPGEVNLSAVLPYLTALGSAEVCFATAKGDLPADLAPIAARMLLEEGARTQWMFAHDDELEVQARYNAIRNEETRARSALRSRLASHGVPSKTVAGLLDPLPAGRVPHLDTVRPIPPGRTEAQVPPYEQMLKLGINYAEPGWLALAYSLLSQMTHMTPLGLLHSAARSGRWGPTLSHEMTALAVDTAALGVTRTVLPHAGVLARTAGLDPIDEWANDLWRHAQHVHQVAQLLHFLD